MKRPNPDSIAREFCRYLVRCGFVPRDITLAEMAMAGLRLMDAGRRHPTPADCLAAAINRHQAALVVAGPPIRSAKRAKRRKTA